MCHRVINLNASEVSLLHSAGTKGSPMESKGRPSDPLHPLSSHLAPQVPAPLTCLYPSYLFWGEFVPEQSGCSAHFWMNARLHSIAAKSLPFFLVTWTSILIIPSVFLTWITLIASWLVLFLLLLLNHLPHSCRLNVPKVQVPTKSSTALKSSYIITYVTMTMILTAMIPSVVLDSFRIYPAKVGCKSYLIYTPHLK